MKPIIISAIVLKDESAEQPEMFKVVVAFKLKFNEPKWQSKQLFVQGWPPEYFYETVAKNGRLNNITEASKYFNQNLDIKQYEQSRF
ncbi:MAG: hypothetical protein K9H61_02395 [Bacteroidia bacterium]|nr:hypothetical protein [Bacteroidia bacterium]MCF8427176.1 hypothetical protein [Bacteroidia bacterium]MCF8445821.1 hypothetical protein [Bacteroidia bacterium]